MTLLEKIFAVVGILVALVVGIGQIYIAKRVKDFELKQDKRNEERKYNEIYATATRFIQKYNNKGYNSEIFLLPFCVSAYKYSPIYPYHRKIYREFCSLTEDVQNEILQRCKLNIKSFKCENFYDNLLNFIRNEISIMYPGDKDILCENGKYFHRTLLNNGNELISQIH